MIDWSTEWYRTLLWLAGAYLLCAIGAFVLGVVLCRRTRFGRQFWRLAGPYFTPRRGDRSSVRPLLTVLLLLFFTVFGVRLSVLASNNGNALYTALQEKDPPTFWRAIAAYAVLALIAVAQAVVVYYVSYLQTIRWRQWTNRQVVTDWLSGTAYHRGRFIAEPVDNPEQRIQADVSSFTSDTQTLVLGLIGAMLTLVSFTAILWRLSGPVDVGGITVPKALVIIAYAFILVATWFAIRIGRPLIRLNFLAERLNASYRYSLTRVRDNSEAIALYGGEGVEEGGLQTRFSAVIANQWALVWRNLKFQGYNVLISQVVGIIAVLVQAPRYFAGQITFGDLTQSDTAFGNVAGSLSFFRNAYDDFASYRATLDRLTGLLDANAQARALPVPLRSGRSNGLEVEGLDVFRPGGEPLVSRLDLSLVPGEWLLVRGRSGSGKTTLLRGLAGLWPYVRGVVSRPQGQVVFCAQQPYLPLGTLRSAITYPAPEDAFPDHAVRRVLADVQLGHLAEHLDETKDWMTTLSPGERQRLAFGRVLLLQPDLVFFDESTSALDEGMEHALYALVRERLPRTSVVSVGHRSSLGASHRRELVLLGQGAWTSGSLVRDSAS
ncbi:putative ATP-binding cassette transporter [Microlunatus sagamiharensis]|uniref:Putative ATP-binding cassette transporter n=1 Tax=Microlunatus sagamiharensis TaxID=546874 RepID=A0A1H2LPN6_9ACTN|nr:ABC transporter ATP-binding protein/permease [Microlunatus sagamiharensis]SDU82950.1 putative ATP-binding cassette transporter [Microlunatus sagamiharensis]